MYTKLINLNVRLHIAREIFYVRELKIYPFEVLTHDPLKEKLQIWEEKLEESYARRPRENEETI